MSNHLKLMSNWSFLQFMMANGALVCVLIHTNVTKYLNFKAVDGSYVYNKGKVYENPFSLYKL